MCSSRYDRRASTIGEAVAGECEVLHLWHKTYGLGSPLLAAGFGTKTSLGRAAPALTSETSYRRPSGGQRGRSGPEGVLAQPAALRRTRGLRIPRSGCFGI